MSSSYHVLCLSHDPAIVIDGDWQHPAAAIAAIADRPNSEHLRLHVDCDLLIGRYSYPLIEVGCPPHAAHPHEALWVEAAWLRVAAILCGPPEPAADVTDALARLPRCWTPTRIQRLRRELAT